MSNLRPVTEHRAAVLAGLVPTEVVRLPLLDAVGLVLAEDVVAPWPLPPFDNSSMDGYAVVAADLTGADEASPVVLAVAGSIAAGGDATAPVLPGTTRRIMTGAPLPPGADAVVPVEETDGGTEQVSVHRSVAAGAFIRRAGDDVAAGEVVLRRGSTVTERSIGVLAGVGAATVAVHRRPVVTVITTGDELVEPGTPLAHGQICESNGLMLAACARRAGAEGVRAGIVRDDAAALRAALDAAAAASDLVVTSGGVSMGAYDTVKEVLAASGEAQFVKVALQPGMPQGHGRLRDGTPVITLPGNPVSSFVAFELFVRPAIRRLLGHERLLRAAFPAVAEEPLDSPAGKEQYVRAHVTHDVDGMRHVRPVGGAASHLVGSLAHADALVVVPAHVTRVEAGELVEVIELGGELE